MHWRNCDFFGFEVFSWVISNSFHFSHVCLVWLYPCSVHFLFSLFFEVSRVVVPTSKDFDSIWFQGRPVGWPTLRLDFMWQIGSHSNHRHPFIPHGHSSLSAFDSEWMNLRPNDLSSAMIWLIPVMKTSEPCVVVRFQGNRSIIKGLTCSIFSNAIMSGTTRIRLIMIDDNLTPTKNCVIAK